MRFMSNLASASSVTNCRGAGTGDGSVSYSLSSRTGREQAMDRLGPRPHPSSDTDNMRHCVNKLIPGLIRGGRSCFLVRTSFSGCGRTKRQGQDACGAETESTTLNDGLLDAHFAPIVVNSAKLRSLGVVIAIARSAPVRFQQQHRQSRGSSPRHSLHQPSHLGHSVTTTA